MDELFDVFDEAPAGDSSKNSKKRDVHGIVKPSPERQLSFTAQSTTDQMSSAATNGSAPASSPFEDRPSVKRQRRDEEPEPVVTDTFETEQSRSIAASAGLQGPQKDASEVVLSHQVRHQVALPPNYDYTPISKHKPPETH